MAAGGKSGLADQRRSLCRIYVGVLRQHTGGGQRYIFAGQRQQIRCVIVNSQNVTAQRHMQRVAQGFELCRIHRRVGR